MTTARLLVSIFASCTLVACATQTIETGGERTVRTAVGSEAPAVPKPQSLHGYRDGEILIAFTPEGEKAIAGAVAAGSDDGGYADFGSAMSAMTGVQDVVFQPDPARRATYDKLYALYREMHDAFGVQGAGGDMYRVMKSLLEIRDAAHR